MGISGTLESIRQSSKNESCTLCGSSRRTSKATCKQLESTNLASGSSIIAGVDLYAY